MTTLFPPSANRYLYVRNTTIATALILAVLAVFWLIGKTDRVVYRGPEPGQIQIDDQILLRTEPVGNYFIERNDIFASMKSGCVYDLSYAPEFGRNREALPRGRTKYIRSATLVSCP